MSAGKQKEEWKNKEKNVKTKREEDCQYASKHYSQDGAAV